MINLQAMKKNFRTEVTSRFVYRSRLMSELGLQALKLIIPILTWKALYEGKESFGSYSLPSMLSYIVIMNYLGFIFSMGHGSDLAGLIKSGKLSAFLLRPISIESYLFPKFLARVIINSLVITVPLIFLILLSGIGMEFQIGLQSVVLVLLNLIFCYYFALLFGISAFWVDEVWPLSHLIRALILVVGGVYFPLDLLPSSLSKVFFLSPFAHLGYLNGVAILGKMSSADMYDASVRACLWIGLSILMLGVFKKLGLRRYEAVGG